MPTLPPAEKLPLALRKNLRDEWEAKKPDLEKQLSELLGEAWTFDVNPQAIWPYATDSFAKDRLGSCLNAYGEGAVRCIKYWLETYGDDGKNELNSICYKHAVTVTYDDTKKYSYCGPWVQDGTLAIVFSTNELGTNCSDCMEIKPLNKALNSAPPPPSSDSSVSILSYSARIGIKKKWDPNVAGVLKELQDTLQNPKINIQPNFDANFTKLKENAKKAGLQEDWESRIGEFFLKYFQGLAQQLKNQKFHEDEMLREGFEEVVDKNEISLVFVDKLEKRTYNETVIKDGTLYIQSTPKYWDTNLDDVGDKLVDEL